MPVYPNFYGNPYQLYPQYQMPQQTVPQQTANGINWVQGEVGAKSFFVGNGQSVWLMDSEKPVFYIKSTDQSGIPQPLRVFDFTERTTQGVPAPENNLLENYVTRQEFEETMSKLLSQKGENENGKSDI